MLREHVPPKRCASAEVDRGALRENEVQVLRRQPDETRDFLLATSVAERFTADLANAMTGRSDSAHLAERLVADNLFIERLDTQPPWYRYHHLFAELLRGFVPLSRPKRRKYI